MFSIRPARFVPFLRNWISYNSVNYKYFCNSMPFLLWLKVLDFSEMVWRLINLFPFT